MMACTVCGKRLDPRTKSGFCKPCSMRPGGPMQAKRLATLAAQTPAERMARFQIRRGDDECWGWSGANNGVGYPALRIHKRSHIATHVALDLDGRPRPSGLHVACHTCDNPICTNPAHLWWGTEKQNMQDASVKGRLSGWSRQKGAKREQGFPVAEVRDAA